MVNREFGRVFASSVKPIIDSHRLEMTICLELANAPGSTQALLNRILVKEPAGSLTVRACKAQCRKHLTALVGDFPDFVNQLRHVSIEKKPSLHIADSSLSPQ